MAFDKILDIEDLEKCVDIRRAEDMYAMLLTNGIGNGFILSVNGCPHCIAYWDKARDETMPDYAELICIHSLYGNWGKGYGSMMMNYILNDIKEAGFSNVVLWAFEENMRARAFYEKHDWVPTGKTKLFCGAVEVMYYKKLM